MRRLFYLVPCCLLVCAVCPNHPPLLRAVFLGNSLSGGYLVGNTPPHEAKPHPKYLPSDVPGDVPSKIQQLSNHACMFTLTYTQNTQASSNLGDHDDIQRYGLTTDELVRNADHDVLVVQAQSEELFRLTCKPTSSSLQPAIGIFNRSVQRSPHAKRLMFETWAQYGLTIDNKTDKQELCMFESILCTTRNLATTVNERLLANVTIAPVGEAWRHLGEKACPKRMNSCSCPPLDAQQAGAKCGFLSSECQEPWSLSGEGLFLPNAAEIHATDNFGAWVSAMVLYGTMHSPPCTPPLSLLERVANSTPELLLLIHEASTAALVGEYRNLTECAVNYDQAASPTFRWWFLGVALAVLTVPACLLLCMCSKNHCFEMAPPEEVGLGLRSTRVEPEDEAAYEYAEQKR